MQVGQEDVGGFEASGFGGDDVAVLQRSPLPGQGLELGDEVRALRHGGADGGFVEPVGGDGGERGRGGGVGTAGDETDRAEAATGSEAIDGGGCGGGAGRDLDRAGRDDEEGRRLVVLSDQRVTDGDEDLGKVAGQQGTIVG